MKFNMMTGILISIILTAIASDRVFGQENSITELRDKRITIQMTKKPLYTVLEHLIVRYDIPIGFEESTLDREHNDFEFVPNLPFLNPKSESQVFSGHPVIKKYWFDIDVESERLENVLNLIVGQMKNYKWEIEEGVVNIVPVRGRDPRFEEFLKIKIKQFSLPKNKPIFMIRTKILELPEVIDFLAKNKLYSSEMKGNFNFTTRPLPVELRFSNLTIRQLLNRITIMKRGGWILKKSDVMGTQEKEYLDIEI